MTLLLILFAVLIVAGLLGIVACGSDPEGRGGGYVAGGIAAMAVGALGLGGTAGYWLVNLLLGA